MKKIIAVFTALCVSLTVLSGCGALEGEQSSYIEELNAALESFTDCADKFSASAEQLSSSSLVPSDEQIDEIESDISALSEVCAEIQGMEPPDEYKAAGEEMASAMQSYLSALSKCSELMEFYRGFDDAIREYDDPTVGSSELQSQAESIYSEFASMMLQATQCFQDALERIDEAAEA